MNYVEPIRKKEDIVAIETFLAKTNKRNQLTLLLGLLARADTVALCVPQTLPIAV